MALAAFLPSLCLVYLCRSYTIASFLFIALVGACCLLANGSLVFRFSFVASGCCSLVRGAPLLRPHRPCDAVSCFASCLADACVLLGWPRVGLRLLLAVRYSVLLDTLCFMLAYLSGARPLARTWQWPIFSPLPVRLADCYPFGPHSPMFDPNC